jgi:excisionase family DNA binding protein
MTSPGVVREFLSAKEVAGRLSISVRSVYRLVARGDLPRPVALLRRKRLWRAADVQRYIDNLLPAARA